MISYKNYNFNVNDDFVMFLIPKLITTIHVVTKNKCTAKIITNGKNTLALTYFGVWDYFKFKTTKIEKFFFCSDDIERFVKGSLCKWVDKFSAYQKIPLILFFWCVKFGTNLTCLEIFKLDNVNFQLS